MIVDTSALVAVIKREPDGERYLETLIGALRRREPLRMTAANYFELGLVIDRLKKPSTSRQVETLAGKFGILIVDVTRDRANAARAAYRRFGKGNHPARLNFGDCFAYALAQETGEPLLFKGDDFALTDVKGAV